MDRQNTVHNLFCVWVILLETVLPCRCLWGRMQESLTTGSKRSAATTAVYTLQSHSRSRFYRHRHRAALHNYLQSRPETRAEKNLTATRVPGEGARVHGAEQARRLRRRRRQREGDAEPGVGPGGDADAQPQRAAATRPRRRRHPHHRRARRRVQLRRGPGGVGTLSYRIPCTLPFDLALLQLRALILCARVSAADPEACGGVALRRQEVCAVILCPHQWTRADFVHRYCLCLALGVGLVVGWMPRIRSYCTSMLLCRKRSMIIFCLLFLLLLKQQCHFSASDSSTHVILHCWLVATTLMCLLR